MLNDLPTELLESICDHVRTEHRLSLPSLSLVSSRLRHIIEPMLYETVRIIFNDYHELKGRIAAMPALASHRLHHLIVEGTFRQYAESKTYTACKMETYRKLPSYATDSFLDEVSVFQSMENDLSYDDHTSPVSWTPLVQLIGRLPSLQKFTFMSFHDIPSDLLDAMQTKSSSCGLYLQHFRNHGWQDWTAPGLLPSARDLWRSSSIRSICAKWSYMTRNVAPDYHHEAVLDMARFVHGIESIHLIYKPPSAGQVIRRTRPPWPGLFTKDERVQDSSSSPSLKSLKLECSSHLKSWLKFINLSQLTSLQLDVISLTDLNRLRKTSLEHLQSLIVKLEHRASSTEPQSLFDETFVHFMLQLNSLTSLKITGNMCDQIFDSILSRHGPSLERLHIFTKPNMDETSRHDIYQFTAERIHNLAEACHNLEELTTNTPRTRGDANEVAIYRNLGAMARLSRLCLILDCAAPFRSNVATDFPDHIQDDGLDPWLPKEDHFVDSDLEIMPWRGSDRIRKGYARDAFVNQALDDTLALSIFKCISDAKPAGSKLLESLKITTCGAFQFRADSSSAMDCWQCLAQYMHRDWHVQRSIRDDRRDELTIDRLDEPGKADSRYADGGDQEAARELFQSVWPGTVEQQQQEDYHKWRGLWVHNWHSFPLATPREPTRDLDRHA